MVRLIVGTDGPDTLEGDPDTLEEIRGGEGNDRLLSVSTATGGIDVLFGEGGDDSILAGGIASTSDGGPGNDTITVTATGFNTIIGGDANDVLLGGPGQDYLAGDEDEFLGFPGPATGNDVLVGGDGSDILFGGPGDDLIEPDAPAETVGDFVFAGDGIDTLVLPGRPDQYDIFFDAALRVYRAIELVGAVALTDIEFSDVEQVSFGLDAVALKAGEVPLALADLTVLLPVAGNRPTIALSDTIEAAVGAIVIPIGVADLLANDFDAEGDALVLGGFDTGSAPATFQVLPDAAGIAAAGYDPARYAGGLILMTLATPFTPTLTFHYTPFDPVHGLDGSTGIITVVAAPQTGAADDLLRGTIAGGEIIRLDTLLANDVPGLTITGLVGGVEIAPGITQLNRSNGSFVLDLAAQTIRFTHANSGPDLISFDYTAADARGTVFTATVQIQADNHAPEAFDRSITVRPGVTTTVLLNDLVAGGGNRDPDGDPLILAGYDLVVPGAFGSVAYFADRIEFTPTAGYVGGYAFDYFIQDVPDLLGAERDVPRVGALLSFVPTAPTRPPVAGDDTVTTRHDSLLSILVADLLANDSDPDGGALSIIALTGAANGLISFDVTGRLSYVPNPGFAGTDSFSYEVSNGTLSSVATVTVQVTNIAPVTADDAFTTRPNLGGILSLADLAGNDVDADGDALVLTAVSGATNGSVLLNGDSIVYAPAAGFVGRDSFTYTISDGIASSTATVTFDVVNGAPVAGTLGPIDIRPRVPLSVDVDVLLAGVTDPDGDALRIFGVVFADHGQVDFDGVQFVYRSEPGYSGPDRFGYLATDGVAEAEGSVLINVVNSAPVAGTLGPIDIRPGVPLSVDVNVLLAGVTDADSDPLSVFGVVFAKHGQVDFDGVQFVYRSEPGYTGPDSFGYLVTDGTTEVEGRVLINVVNRAPIAVADGPYDIRPGVPLSIDTGVLLANDSDPDFDPLRIFGVVFADHGHVDFDGVQFVYRAPAGYSGPDRFGYLVTDGTAEVEGTVLINVIGDAPIATPDAFAVRHDATLAIAAAALLANDRDPQSDPLIVAAVTQPGHGSLTLQADGSYAYQPDPGFVGLDSFTYAAGDGTNQSAFATVTIDVTNAAPAVPDPAVTIPSGGAITLQPLDLLAGATDPDGDPLTIFATGAAVGGSVVLTAAGVVFTPDVGFVGAASFGFTVSDGFGGTDTALLRLAVLQAPVPGGGGLLTAGPGNNVIDLSFVPQPLRMLGGRGSDDLTGGSGNDTLVGGPSDDTLRGSDGDDAYRVDSAGDVIVEAPSGGIDLVRTGIDWTLGAEIESLVLLGSAGLRGSGNALDNLIRGNAGDNLLEGLAGDDTVRGGDGADTLIGGLGADQLDGDRGMDVFRYGSPAAGGDTIVGYVGRDDAIEVSAGGFGGGLTEGMNLLAASRYVSGAGVTANQAFGQFLFDTTTQMLSWDADGTGAAAAVLIADLTGARQWTGAEISVIA